MGAFYFYVLILNIKEVIMSELFARWNKISLVKRILIGLIIGVILALTIP